MAYRCFDTDAASLNQCSSSRSGGAKLSERDGEFVRMEAPNIATYLSSAFRSQVPNYVSEWLDFNIDPTINGSDGAGGVRQCGRLLMFQNVDRIRESIASAIRNMTAGQEVIRLNIYVMAGVGGGTGSGTYLDLAYIARDVAEGILPNKVTSYGYIFMPDVNLSRPLSEETKTYIRRNGYAALRELDYVMNMHADGGRFTQRYSNTYVIDTERAPFNYVHLVSASGASGMVQVLNHFLPWIPVGSTALLMNIPLLIIGVKKMGWPILFSTVFATAVSNLMIDGMDMLYRFPAMDPLLACLYGGVLLGIALGAMMRKTATTGGTELAARLLKFKIHSLSIGKICLVIDVAVVLMYALSYGAINYALYGIIAMYVSSVAMDMVVYGSINAKLAIIISDRQEAITKSLMAMGLGATILQGAGAWTGNEKRVLMCAAKPRNITAIKSAVTAIDPEKSFIIVCDAREVYGEGFGEFSANSL